MDKKLTDNEIVKALEDCLKNECDKCPFNNSETCQIDLMKLLFDLINRLEARIGIYETCNARKDEAIKHLEAENERLKEEIELLHSDYTYKLVKKKAKSEAYKEFADRLKSIIMWSPKNHISITAKDVEVILKEMGCE